MRFDDMEWAYNHQFWDQGTGQAMVTEEQTYPKALAAFDAVLPTAGGLQQTLRVHSWQEQGGVTKAGQGERPKQTGLALHAPKLIMSWRPNIIIIIVTDGAGAGQRQAVLGST